VPWVPEVGAWLLALAEGRHEVALAGLADAGAHPVAALVAHLPDPADPAGLPADGARAS
jgi:hypothetical protein